MERRLAIKNLAVTVAGVMFLPGCTISSESKEAVNSFLSTDQDLLLAGIVDAIIPTTESTPGAKALLVHDYIKLMVVDCHELEVHNILRGGLDTFQKMSQNDYGKSYADLELQQKEELLLKIKDVKAEPDIADKEVPDDTEKDVPMDQFYNLVKGLTVQGYLTSEYVMANHSDYIMVPGPEYGCIPVASKQNI